MRKLPAGIWRRCTRRAWQPTLWSTAASSTPWPRWAMASAPCGCSRRCASTASSQTSSPTPLSRGPSRTTAIGRRSSPWGRKWPRTAWSSTSTSSTRSSWPTRTPGPASQSARRPPSAAPLRVGCRPMATSALPSRAPSAAPAASSSWRSSAARTLRSRSVARGGIRAPPRASTPLPLERDRAAAPRAHSACAPAGGPDASLD
mmetsp:Transcript_53636/g.143738  ORF Transcript_53636/g.143738 Transcript_53636/m.143738 type:complete len:203 (+) Transcript_53636:1356-1964(+)